MIIIGQSAYQRKMKKFFASKEKKEPILPNFVFLRFPILAVKLVA